MVETVNNIPVETKSDKPSLLTLQKVENYQVVTAEAEMPLNCVKPVMSYAIKNTVLEGSKFYAWFDNGLIKRFKTKEEYDKSSKQKEALDVDWEAVNKGKIRTNLVSSILGKQGVKQPLEYEDLQYIEWLVSYCMTGEIASEEVEKKVLNK